MPRKPASERARRRARAREAKRLREDLEKLARLGPGGRPNRPLEVTSPAQVDARAEATPCPLCGGRLALDEHRAETIDGRRLRVADCRCVACHAPRRFYFRLTGGPQG